MGHAHDQLRRQAQASFNRYSDGCNYNPSVFAPGAKCPNHRCRLYLTDQPGLGICEISGYAFRYEEGPSDEKDQYTDRNREMTIQIINGQPQKVFKVAPGWKRHTTRDRRDK